MNTLQSPRIIACTSPTELYRHYDQQSEAQPAYIELDLRQGTLLADYNSEVGNAIPSEVFHGFERRYGVPVLTGEAANRVMEEIAPLTARILADWEEQWDGNNKRAVLGPDAQEAEEAIKELLGEADHDDRDLVAQWDIDGAVNGYEAEEYGIAASTTDERLEEIAQKIEKDMAETGDTAVAVVHGLVTYLRGLRESAAADDEEN